MQRVEHRFDPLVIGMHQRIDQDHRDRTTGCGEKAGKAKTGQDIQRLWLFVTGQGGGQKRGVVNHQLRAGVKDVQQGKQFAQNRREIGIAGLGLDPLLGQGCDGGIQTGKVLARFGNLLVRLNRGALSARKTRLGGGQVRGQGGKARKCRCDRRPGCVKRWQAFGRGAIGPGDGAHLDLMTARFIADLWSRRQVSGRKFQRFRGPA